MTSIDKIKFQVAAEGYAILENIYTSSEVDKLLSIISQAGSSKSTFRKTTDLFAIRQFLKEIPEATPVIFNENLSSIISNIFGEDYFVVKSIYFDKPAASNWFVAYHQDLTISLDKKTNTEGFSAWTTKQNQYAVQPPLSMLEKNFTVRIHLDDTTENNGALKVIPASHLKGIQRSETIDLTIEKEVSCCVSRGGIMIMKPLLFHASGRTINNQQRRVVHIEFSNQLLPKPLQWSEHFAVA
ncbi:MAG: phytanoyl-CoA dioxygenase [Flavisolibacter sp.]|nr:phytanoyl-CoA dioxygenase [Flavisolibacter sp.]